MPPILERIYHPLLKNAGFPINLSIVREMASEFHKCKESDRKGISDK
jgi:hypothetical protein